jgi:hypothetical protein
VDAYAELAALVAMWLRPRSISQAAAVRAAQEELDRLVAWPPRNSAFLVALVEAVAARLRA